MVGIRTVAAFAGFASFALMSAASADPITFAQLIESNNDNGLTWTNNGTSSTLNTTNAGGDVVNFSFENVAGLNSSLAGPLVAIETINGGAGATTNVAAGAYGGLLVQSITSPLTISYNLVNPIGGLTDLLTITITPISATSGGAILDGQVGGTGGSLLASYPPETNYTETFSSDFLTLGDPITASYSLSAINPIMSLGAGGMLSTFTADLSGTFSAAVAPIAVGEPASLAILAVGLIGLGFASRRRFSQPA